MPRFAICLLLFFLSWMQSPARLSAQGDENATEEAAPTWRQAREAIAENDSETAERILTQLIESKADDPQLYYWRGRERFRLGKFAESVADFDQYLEIRPDQASRQWERGIALYYAGDFAAGAKQFELYQTYHNADAENTLWRFLCQARSESLEAARGDMLATEPDRRPAMDAILDLYRGKLTGQEVLAQAEDRQLSDQAKAGARFYVWLYLGLYHDIQGETDQAREYLAKAADPDLLTQGQSRINRYMWDVARLHLATLPPAE